MPLSLHLSGLFLFLCKKQCPVAISFPLGIDQKHELMLEKLFNEVKNNYQIIIVTHKLNIYRSAESLLGTYFNKNMDTSVPISIENK